MENIFEDIKQCLKEFNKIGYIFKGEIVNYVFINFKVYTKDNEFIYQETLWADYILAEKDEVRRKKYITDFTKTFMINAFSHGMRLIEKRLSEIEG